MPAQQTLFGRPITFRLNTRYQGLLVAVGLFMLACFLFGSPTNIDHVPSAHEVAEKIKNPNIPSLSKVPQAYNPFAPAAHAPPVQANSSAGESKWFSDWKWMNPFSSQITLDENRSVLPPLMNRPAVYTFYDGNVKQDPAIREAEEKLLLQWRRAWWAQGFKPIVLGRAEATNNPLYKQLQLLNLHGTPELERLELEMARWLAWDNMGTGILTNWLTFPMAPYQDPFLSFLRRGEYPALTRYETLKSGLFVGSQADINAAVKSALNNPALKEKTGMIDAIPKEAFKVDERGDSVALYDREAIQENYRDVAKKLEDKAEGLLVLAQLINSHLHTVWQNNFDKGISIVKPLPQHMTALTEEAIDIARNLTQCPETPMPASCPPNRSCNPCVASTPMKIKLMQIYRNETGLYTIGTVPHPYTFLSLHYQRDNIDARFMRREVKDRDLWITSVTKELLGTGKSAPSRISHFKSAVASEHGMHNSLWLTAERETHKDLNWVFGFELPTHPPSDGKSETPVPGPERRPPPPKPDGVVPSEEELAQERDLLNKARWALKNKVKEMARIREMVEAWNLADSEAWRFSRAFSARRRVERLKWEEEESSYAGAEKNSNKGGWGSRWSDS